MDAEHLVDLYLNAHQAAGRTEQTISWHRHSLTPFVAWLREHGHSTNPSDWSAKLIREWIVYCQTRPAKRGTGTLSDSGVNSLIRSLKAFCRWLAEEELVDRDPFQRVKVPKAPRLVKPSLSADEMTKVLAVARTGRNRYRDEAVLLFILDTGARASEVCGLRADAIDWSSGIAQPVRKGSERAVRPVLHPHCQSDAAIPDPGTRGQGSGSSFCPRSDCRLHRPVSTSSVSESALRRKFTSPRTSCAIPLPFPTCARAGTRSPFRSCSGIPRCIPRSPTWP